ncbi:transcriptional regulator ATRX homolog [Watersipora subatra]|uniref:transcriptional regulator ATRX homolog n=1 Tax=Watersipora subatra TaxID=2589382 RepID=UPI00355B1E95
MDLDFFTPEEYTKYVKYLNSERTRQFNSKPPPPAYYRFPASKSSRKYVNKFPNNRRSASARNDQKERDLEVSPRQSAPKPFEQRAPAVQESTAHQREDKDSERQAGMKKPVDTTTEYMMYSEPDSPKRENSTEFRSRRPKSSKFRMRNEQTSNAPPHHSDEERTAEEESDGFWQQPPPPVRETEPDGTGLNMTKDGHLSKDGQAIEEISSTENQEEKQSRETKRKEDESGSEKDEQTYDIKHEDGTKTRVYAPPLHKSTTEDIPVVTEENKDDREVRE